MSSKKIFLSAVSAEFSGYREELDRRLSDHVHVRTQEYFSQGAATLLEKLDDYIRSCDAVIHLVGAAHGSAPAEIEVQALLRRNPDLATFPLGFRDGPASYTQWEAYLALVHQRPLFVFIAELKAGSQGPEGFDPEPGDAESQRAHLKLLFSRGIDRSSFSGPQDLALQALSALVREGLQSGPERRLNNLPLGSIHELFMGRDATLAELGATLEEPPETGPRRPVSIHGLAGVGKTRLALEYAWRNESRFTSLLFVSADTPEDLKANLAALAAPDILNLPEHYAGSEDEARDAVVRWLQSHHNWLLILDNVDSREGQQAVLALAPRLGAGRLLITSRLSHWGRSVRRVPLRVLERGDAVKLLLESVARTEGEVRALERVARSIAGKLGCLPLALTHATAYIAYFGVGLEEYLEHFDNKFSELMSYHDSAALEYDTSATTPENVKTIASTFFLSFDRLGSVEKAVLQAASFLAPESVPLSFFETSEHGLDKLVTRWNRETGESGSAQPSVDRAVAELANFSLIERSGRVFSVHRLVHRLLRARPSAENAKGWLDDVQSMVNECVPDETAESPATWDVWDEIRPHAEELVDQTKGQEGIEAPLLLMRKLAALYFGKGLFDLSRAMDADRVVEVERVTDGSESKEMADALLAVGESYRVTNDTENAVASLRRSLAIRESLDGPESERVAVALNYLGLALDNDEGLECYRRAIAIYEALGDSVDPSDYAKTLNNLAVAIRGDDRSEALDRLRRANELVHQGDVKPQLVIICKLQYAGLMAENDPEAAEELYLEACELAELFPPSHQFRGQALSSYAQFLRSAGRLQEARDVFSRVEYADVPGRSDAGVASKLRIVESTIELRRSEAELVCAHPPVEESADTTTLFSVTAANVQGVKIEDPDSLRLTFSIADMDELEPEERGAATQQIIQLCREALSLPETSLWAPADWDPASEVRGTLLGDVLKYHAGVLRRFVCERWTSDEALRSLAVSPDEGDAFVLELWLIPDKQTVYVGGLENAEPEASERDEDQVHILECDISLSAEVRGLAARGSNVASRILEAVHEHLLADLRTVVNEAPEFNVLRQANRCMLLATWLKQKLLWREISRQLETGEILKLSLTSVPSEAGQDALLRYDVRRAEARDPISLESGLALNELSVFLRGGERSQEALDLAQRSLAIEEHHREDAHPQVHHRLLNLVLCLLICGQYGKARSVLERTERLTKGRGDVLEARCVILQALRAALVEEECSQQIGALRRLLSGERLAVPEKIAPRWGLEKVLATFEDTLSSSDRDFFARLALALNDPREVRRLEDHPQWRAGIG